MRKQYAYVLAAVILWGLTYLLLADLLKKFPPSELLVIRFGGSFIITGLLLCVVGLRSSSKESEAVPVKADMSRWKLVSLALLAGLYLGLASTTQKYGIRLLGKPVQAAFETALVALFLPTLQKTRTYFFPRYRPATFAWKNFWFPLFLAVVGTALLCDVKLPALGDILVILCALFYALQLDQAGAFKKEWSPAATHICGCVSCIALGIVLAATIDSGDWTTPRTAWEYSGLGVLILFSTFIPWYLLHWTVQEGGVEQYVISILYTLEPVVTLVVGWPLMAAGLPVGVEEFGPVKLFGCFLIVWSAERTCRL